MTMSRPYIYYIHNQYITFPLFLETLSTFRMCDVAALPLKNNIWIHPNEPHLFFLRVDTF